MGHDGILQIFEKCLLPNYRVNVFSQSQCNLVMAEEQASSFLCPVTQSYFAAILCKALHYGAVLLIFRSLFPRNTGSMFLMMEGTSQLAYKDADFLIFKGNEGANHHIISKEHKKQGWLRTSVSVLR